MVVGEKISSSSDIVVECLYASASFMIEVAYRCGESPILQQLQKLRMIVRIVHQSSYFFRIVHVWCVFLDHIT